MQDMKENQIQECSDSDLNHHEQGKSLNNLEL